MIAAELRGPASRVLVLEMGGYRNESDFKQLELPGMLELYLGGGLAASEDGSIAILAGSTLGGGTVVNYMNCIRTPEHIRREWAAHGLEGIDEPGYDAAHRRGLERIGAERRGDLPEPHPPKMIAGCDELGYRAPADHAQRRRLVRRPAASAATATRAASTAASSRR